MKLHLLIIFLFLYNNYAFCEDNPSSPADISGNDIILFGIVASVWAMREEPGFYGLTLIMASASNQPPDKNEHQIITESLGLIALGTYNMTRLNDDDVSANQRTKENIVGLGLIALASYGIGKLYPSVNQINPVQVDLVNNGLKVSKTWRF